MTEREIVLAMWADIARRRAESQGVISAVSLVLVHIMADSVSYTHLRAHETVLDLVCRLLLEKKKQYQSTSSRI